MKPEANPKMMVLSSPVGLRSIINSLVAFSIIVSSVTLLFYQGQEGQVPMVIEHEHPKMQVQMAAEHHEQLRVTEAPVPLTAELPDARKEECNWSTGRWVYDNLSRPLYSGLKCSFIFPELSCDKYGRKDVMYHSTSTGDGNLMDATFLGMIITDFPSLGVFLAQFCSCHCQASN